MSQSVLVQCPHCRAEGNLADPALFGKAISCPVCQQIFTAPVPPASEPPVAAAPAAVATPAASTAETPPAAADSPTMVDGTSPSAASESITARYPVVEQAAIAEALVTATTQPAVGDPISQFASTELPPVAAVAQPVESTPATAMNLAAPVGIVPDAATALPTGQSISVQTLPAPESYTAPASTVPSVANVPAAVPAAPPGASPIAAPMAAPPSLDVPGVPPAMASVPGAPITFPGQAAAFPTEIALPQDGVFVPPPVAHTFDGPLPAFLAPPSAPGAEETRFAESLPEPVARGSVKPPKAPSKSMQTIIVGTITVVLLFATVMFLMGDPSRRFGKKPKSKVSDEDNPIAQPLDSGPADQSIEDVFARINAASKSGDTKNGSDGSKEKK